MVPDASQGLPHPRTLPPLGTPVTVDVERALQVQAVIEAAALSARARRTVPVAEILRERQPWVV